MSSPTPPEGARLRLALTRAGSRPVDEMARRLSLTGDTVLALVDASRAGEQPAPEPPASRLPGRGEVLEQVVDLANPSVVEALDGVDVLIHLPAEAQLDRLLSEPPARRRERLLQECRTLVTAAAAAGVPHVVLVTSAMVLGARPGNPVPLLEDSSLRTPDVEGLVAELVAVEAEVRSLVRAHPGLRLTLVRHAALVGHGADTMITRHFEAPRLLAVRGTSPAWQFCHVHDLASALLVVARGGLPEVLAVAAPGSLSQAEVERLTGMRSIELSAQTAQATADRLHRLGVVPVPSSDLAYVMHPWAVHPAALLDAGWRPAHDNASCARVLAEEVRGQHALLARRVRSREAAVGAATATASAAVAVAATAALVRRRRH